jgi:hypothetical protein
MGAVVSRVVGCEVVPREWCSGEGVEEQHLGFGRRATPTLLSTPRTSRTNKIGGRRSPFSAHSPNLDPHPEPKPRQQRNP